ncbi:hypothetical protein MCON_3395 [Methanothrix soehngenii GP6]|uniref:Uncharacterized protein n=1 Tax=Methanothrix soehngenii (strain ATCC 5969 / DSM 3671 / JCM 10134 / NBRC 103675 / OCM 69 / GP-6) TaxID=990316 RepID=F4BVM6_METSG|nr:hypothetical protein MCON_3395 [Methanothrix soehngenii GP6]
MAKKMAVFQFPFHRDRLCNVAADRISDHLRIMSFNSLFIGIGSAIELKKDLTKQYYFVSIPFSSG